MKIERIAARETAQEETRQKARERLERERQLKKVRADKQRDTEEQRHAALNAFREDRSEAAERVARQRRAEAAATEEEVSAANSLASYSIGPILISIYNTSRSHINLSL